MENIVEALSSKSIQQRTLESLEHSGQWITEDSLFQSSIINPHRFQVFKI